MCESFKYLLNNLLESLIAIQYGSGIVGFLGDVLGAGARADLLGVLPDGIPGPSRPAPG